MVYGHHRALRTGAEARVVLECNATIRRVSLGGQAQGVQRRFHDGRGTQEMAGRPPAHLNYVIARRGKAEVGVERGHAPDIVDSGVGERSHLFDGLRWYVAQSVLNHQERRQDCNRAILAVG